MTIWSIARFNSIILEVEEETMLVSDKKEKQKEIDLLVSYADKKKKAMTQQDANAILYQTGMYTKNGALKKQFK